jgi:hypothetical protein
VVPGAYAVRPKLKVVEVEEVQFLNKVSPPAVDVPKPAPEFKRVKFDVGETFTTIEIGSTSKFPFGFVTVNEAPVDVTVLYVTICGPTPVALDGLAPVPKLH